MTLAIIPARMASTRFPGKPLAKIHGLPMIGHCYFRTTMSSLIDHTYIATCDEEIMDFAKAIKAPSIMTSASHERASDRIAEAMVKIEKETGEKHEIVVLVQGDEPMLHPEMIDDLVRTMIEEPEVDVANGFSRIESLEDFEDPNEVKVVIDQKGYAIYFSREPIPSNKKSIDSGPMYKQVCIIPFRREYLLHFNNAAQTPLEITESIDMLRAIEGGQKVRMVEMKHQSYSVDTHSDLERVKGYMKSDKLRKQYGI